ncbi:DUF1018 domain-containing protein [bacterium]|nr:DUF1018 domain-containing protein [bacterium]
MILSNSKQRQLIGYFRKLLKISEEAYQEILASYSVESSKELSYTEAQELLNNLKDKAITFKLYQPKTSKQHLKYENMYARYGYATPKQLRMIESMWNNVTRQNGDKNKEIALNHFVKRIVGKEHIKFITQKDVSKLKMAIENMAIKNKEELCEQKR